MSDHNLESKLALVTGGMQGIGRGIVEGLLAGGARVALVDLSPEPSAAAAASLGNEDRVRGYGCDVSNYDAVAGLTARIESEFGPVDFLVNNAGITQDNLLARMKISEWNAVISVNLSGTFHFCQALARPMMKRRQGRVVNIASVVGQMGNAGQVNYSASKAGVIGLTKSMAKELAPRGITVNAVAPGFIKTAMTESLSEDVKAAMMSSIPLACLGETEDITASVLFLLSEGARYITGQVIGVNGGMFMNG
jgi:3-oxoacyl-[acyl-carrier protein] reductase